MKVNETINKEALHVRREFEDMRDLIEEAAKLYEDRIAYSYRVNPRDREAVKISFVRLRDDVRALATEFIKMGVDGKKCALIGKLSYGWVCTYFAALISGAVLVPLDRDWHGADLADTVKKAEAELDRKSTRLNSSHIR